MSQYYGDLYKHHAVIKIKPVMKAYQNTIFQFETCKNREILNIFNLHPDRENVFPTSIIFYKIIIKL